MTYDDHRSILFTGANDGSVFVRGVEVTSTLGAAPHVTMRLVRFCSPAPVAAGASVGAGTLTSMWYDTGLDRLYTGDMSGVSRVIKRVCCLILR